MLTGKHPLHLPAYSGVLPAVLPVRCLCGLCYIVFTGAVVNLPNYFHQISDNNTCLIYALKTQIGASAILSPSQKDSEEAQYEWHRLQNRTH